MWVYKSKVLHVALATLVAFIPMVLVMSAYDLYLLVGSILFTTAVGALHAYWPAMKLAVNMSVSELSRIDVLTAAIMFLLFATAMREVYVTFWLEFFPLPVARPDSYYLWLAFMRYTAVCATMLFLCSRKPVYKHGFLNSIPGWPRGVVALGCGLLIGFALIAQRYYLAG